MKDYELLEHTADIAIRVKSKDLGGLFQAAACAMFDIAAEKKPAKDKEIHKISVNQKAESIEELFINWLNELLSLSAVEGLIFEDYQISNIDRNSIEAVAMGSNIENYRMNTEIKAATYHELKVEDTPVGWVAEVIFDV